jgi:hypothetical protein
MERTIRLAGGNVGQNLNISGASGPVSKKKIFDMSL